MDIRLNQTVNIKSQTTSSFIYYTPSEIRNAYNATSLLNDGYTGSGVTISIVDAYGDPYIQSELNNFSATFGIPTTTVNVVCVDGPCNYYNGMTYGWNSEIALDVEWAHAMAPGATINLYIGSNSGQPLYDAVAAAVAGTNGNGTYLSPSSIISMSWGTPENDIGESGAVAPVFGENYPWLNEVFQQGAAEGITFFASSGDWGAYDQAMGQTSPYGGAIYPSTDPFVTGIGGTSLYMSTKSGYLQLPAANATGSYGYETAWSWNNRYDWATGGGFSTFFSQPYWQTGPGVPSGETRGAPDVSWDADPLTGVLVYVDGAFYDYGGTSVGSPSWAGSMALIDQKAGHDLGLINPSLYSILKNPSDYTRAFHDVTVGDNDPLQAGPGWDPLTGVGTPNIGELAYYLAQPSASLSVHTSSDVPLGKSASYNSVQIYATVTSGTRPITSGTGSAVITSSTGGLVANIAMSCNGTAWTGTYKIKPTDPPGMWVATVHITSGSQTGTGTTTFSVGDGITMFASWGFYLVGDTIPIAAVVTGPDGSNVTSGSFSATFFLGTPSGSVEGSVPLAYNPATYMWEGAFTISPSADQGAWVLSINGTDSSGNRAATAYTWVNVGLVAHTSTDSPTYLSGDSISIYSGISYDGHYHTTGAYNATVWLNGKSLGMAPLSYNAEYDLWTGSFSVPLSDSAGFYQIVVTGDDGSGNSAYGETLVRVATPSVTSLSCTSPVKVGASSTCIATVSGNSPSGTVSFTASGSGSFSSEVCTLTGGSCSVDYVPSTTAGSPQTINGSYGGDINSPPSNGTSSITVNPATSATAVTCGPSTFLLGTSTTCTVTVTDYNPTGMVSWSQSGGTGSVTISPVSCTLSSSHQCQVIVKGTAAGSVTLNASYGGDSNDPPDSGTFAVTVNPVNSLMVSCTPTSVVVGASAACEATVSGPPTPRGKIAWLSNGPDNFSALTCRLKEGACSVKYTATSAGFVTITASYSGNDPASSGNSSLLVTVKPSTTKVSCTPTSVVVGSSKVIKCTATVTGYSPTGTVAWSPSGTNVSSVTFISGVDSCVLSKGSCFVTVTGTGAGTISIDGTYSGDSNNTGSSKTTTLTIKPAKTSFSLSCASMSKDVWICTATLKGHFGSAANETADWSQVAGTGSISFSSPICTLPSAGTCSITVTGKSPGNVKIEVAYAGDSNDQGSSKKANLKVTFAELSEGGLLHREVHSPGSRYNFE